MTKILEMKLIRLELELKRRKMRWSAIKDYSLNRQLNSCCWWTYKLWGNVKHHMIANNIYLHPKFKIPYQMSSNIRCFVTVFFILISWSNFRNRYSKCVSLFNIFFLLSFSYLTLGLIVGWRYINIRGW